MGDKMSSEDKSLMGVNVHELHSLKHTYSMHNNTRNQLDLDDTWPDHHITSAGYVLHSGTQNTKVMWKKSDANKFTTFSFVCCIQFQRFPQFHIRLQCIQLDQLGHQEYIMHKVCHVCHVFHPEMTMSSRYSLTHSVSRVLEKSDLILPVDMPPAMTLTDCPSGAGENERQ